MLYEAGDVVNESVSDIYVFLGAFTLLFSAVVITNRWVLPEFIHKKNLKRFVFSVVAIVAVITLLSTVLNALYYKEEYSFVYLLCTELITTSVVIIFGLGIFFLKNSLSIVPWEFQHSNGYQSSRKQPEETQSKSESSVIVGIPSLQDIELSLICYANSLGNYVKLFFEDGSFKIVHISTKKLYSVLPDSEFIRIHKSFIINISYIQEVYGNKILLKNGTEIPVGRKYKILIEERLPQTNT